MRMPAVPATMALIAQLASAMRSGEMPLTSAPVSVSDAARVAMPKWVKRYTAASASAMATMVIASQSRSVGTVRSPGRSVCPVGKIGATRICDVPTLWAISAVSNEATPSEATALATGVARRSGRKTTSHSATPTSPSIRMAMTMASANGTGPPTSTVLGNGGSGMSSSPRRRNANVNAACSASAPVAKLTTPELR